MKKLVVVLLCALMLLTTGAQAQTHPAVKRFLGATYMKGASVSLMIKEINGGKVICSHDADRELIPASVMKTVTTAAALDILGENFRYETAILYDGQIRDSTLYGNLYIRGSGDPSIGSSYLEKDAYRAVREWIDAIKKKGIRKIDGAVIADESVFDTEGVSMKWLREDLGSDYGQGSYGLNINNNCFTLLLNSGEPGSKPEITGCEPATPPMVFHNYLTVKNTASDSCLIVGAPFSNERYLYGVVPANRAGLKIKGDIPDPALFFAHYLTKRLEEAQIAVSGVPSCCRLLLAGGQSLPEDCTVLATSFSPPLKELARIANFESSNLYADAFLKTLGLRYRSDEALSSFGKGIKVVREHWKSKQLDVSPLWMFDGSGLAATDKATASFLCGMLLYMSSSKVSKSFSESLPRAGMEGTVKNMFAKSPLKGKTRLKSGSMSRVRCYAGYVSNGGKQYAVAILVNNFSCPQSQIRIDIERLLDDLL